MAWPEQIADLAKLYPPGQQCPEQRLAIDRVSLRAPLPSGYSDGRRIDKMAFDAVCFEQSMYPKAIKASLLDDDDFG